MIMQRNNTVYQFFFVGRLDELFRGGIVVEEFNKMTEFQNAETKDNSSLSVCLQYGKSLQQMFCKNFAISRQLSERHRNQI